jgi:hypothetical protein
VARIGEHALVLGASIGGLLAARILTEFYDRVTVVERDTLPERAEQRRGVPQGRHVHALLASGSNALGELFPGILNELDDDGAVVVDTANLTDFWGFSAGTACAENPDRVRVPSGRIKRPARSSKPTFDAGCVRCPGSRSSTITTSAN